MPQTNPTGPFLLCERNEGYPASLEVRKVYQALPDPVAASRGFVRVVDESGEDHRYPSERSNVSSFPAFSVKKLLNILVVDLASCR
jgi:hypothetical protein